MQTEKYEFWGIGSPRRDFPTDGSLKKRYLSKVLHPPDFDNSSP